MSRVTSVRITKVDRSGPDSVDRSGPDSVDRSGPDSVDHTTSSVMYTNDGTMASIQFPSKEEDRKGESLDENVENGNQNGDQSGNRDANETTDGGNNGNENRTETSNGPDIDYLKDVGKLSMQSPTLPVCTYSTITCVWANIRMCNV